MKQITQVNDQLKRKIIELENECEEICEILEQKYQPEFKRFGQKLVIELLRTINGKNTANIDILEIDYESFIEIGIEYGDEYYPNICIPIWKCKTEWFQKIGYLTRWDIAELKTMISLIVLEMLEDKE